MSASVQQTTSRRVIGPNIWLSGSAGTGRSNRASGLQVYEIQPEILDSEEAVGRAQLDEIERYAGEKSGDIVLVLLGGRGAQALYRIVGKLAQGSTKDELLGRLHVFTQDALAPLRMNNGLSFVRDFERLLGDAFFGKVKSFTPMRTDTDNLEDQLTSYINTLQSLGGIDIFLLGLGPEGREASHLAYIKPGSGAKAEDFAGLIPISASILEHHIAKFKAGGSEITPEDEAECRAATHILTLGPAAILSARKIVQSIVDASTAPAKRASYRRVLDTKLSDDPAIRDEQLDENPGLWLRLHSNVRSLILPDVLNS